MLADKFNRVHDYLRISLTDKCNLRCIYCNPIDLPKGHFTHSNKMSVEEIDRIVDVFVQLGIRKIRLTGGEPLVRKDVGQIIERLSKYPVELALTTNGVFVDEHIETFQRAGIQSVNVSLDSLKPHKNAIITGRSHFGRVWQNIHLLLENHFRVKINTVVMKGVNESEIPDFIEWTRELPIEVRFIEFMPFSGNHWSSSKVFSHDKILELISGHHDFIKLPDKIHDTTKKFQIPGYRGSFAVISSMSHPFCAGCNRLRLTTDGKMKNCLFSGKETDILGALRTGMDIVPLIKQCVLSKEEFLGGQMTPVYKNTNAAKIDNRSMISIGG